MAKSNNQYLKKIDEKVKGEEVEGVHQDNYYLKEISENIGTGGGDVDLSKYIQKSNTEGLVKNDGTIDSTQYLSEHQDISGKLDSSDLDTLNVTVTYTDESSDSFDFAIWSD